MSEQSASERADDLRASVRDYRDPRTPVVEQHAIRQWWHDQGIPNQFAAMLRARALEREAEAEAASS